MHRIDHPTAVSGLFTEGNAGGTPATVLTADWLNNAQEELVGLVVASGAAPDKTKSDQLLKAIMNLAHPVGTVYTSQRLDKTPFQLFGIGTWVEICKGRVPVGLDPAQTEFDTIGKQGGAKTVALTAAQNGPHNHPQDPDTNYNIPQTAGSGSQPGPWVSGGGSRVTGASGSGDPHNNLQPYEVVGRIWKRTA